MLDRLFLTADFPGFSSRAPFCAEGEAKIDFRHNPSLAQLCTCAFCALELKKYLNKMYTNTSVDFADIFPSSEACIHLVCSSNDLSDGGFEFIPEGSARLKIVGKDRNGIVNGIYEFLRLQGWRWFEPGDEGEYRISNSKEIVFPSEYKKYIPSFRYRAFYFEFQSQESEEFLIWMARNRMNVYGAFPETSPLAQKLGMYLLTGGHILTKLLNPTRIMESGKTLFEEHSEWFGTPASPKIKTPENAMEVQFCCTNSSLMDFIAEELVFRLNHLWKTADIIEISGFDTWGKTCECVGCSKFPSSTDKYLNFMAEIRKRLDKAEKGGRIDHPVKLNSWAYEGTATMEPPKNDVPACMAKAGDNNVAFVIKRCYRHDIDDPDCASNIGYANSIREWGRLGKKLTLWSGEYYGVSRHSDLPLLFTNTIRNSMRFYHECGVRGATYMHTPIINWGLVGMTQMLHSLLSWDVKADTEKACNEFLNARYETHSAVMVEVRKLLENASKDIAEWRSWGTSILSVLNLFDGKTADQRLYCRHYQNNADVIVNGYRIAELYSNMLQIVRKEFELEQKNAIRNFHPATQLARNPEEELLARNYCRIEKNLALDVRQLEYGRQTILLMTLCADYYESCRNGGEAKKTDLWQQIELLSRKMQESFAPIAYRAYIRHFRIHDVLTHSQLRDVVAAIRKVRLENNLG